MRWLILGTFLLLGCTEYSNGPVPVSDMSLPPPKVEPPPCMPTGGGPYWIEEGETIEVLVRCSTERKVAGEEFHFVSLPKGARFDPQTQTLSWTPGLDQADVWLLVVTVGNENGTIKIGVADKFDDPDNVPIASPRSYSEEFGLPVFHLTTTPALDAALPSLRAENSSMQSNSCAPICIADPDSPIEIIHRGRVYQAEGHYRGASSLNYPKKNYTLKFPKGNRFQEPLMAGGRMNKRREIALISTFDDNSYLRWRMSFELWNRMAKSAIQIEHFSAVVYVDGKYHGLYAVSDKINDEMMERHGLSEYGNLYMGINHNANFDSMARQGNMVRPRLCGYEGYTKKEGIPDKCDEMTFVPEAFEDLSQFHEFVATSSDEDFAANIDKTIHLENYYDWIIHSTAIVAVDSYEKNALHYHDPVAQGLWRVIVWDYNGSFGQSWNTVRQRHLLDPAAVATDAGPPAKNRLWYRLWQDPTFGPELQKRYANALRTVIKIEDVLQAFDGMVKQTAPSALRDERKWAAAYRTYYGPTSSLKRMDLTTYSEEIPYIREWLVNRWAYLSTQFQ